MASIKEIIEKEHQNTDKIILHKEGIFWKAYERSKLLNCYFAIMKVQFS
jgi:hypothetical protein